MRAAALALLAALLLGGARAAFHVETAGVAVLSPSSARKRLDMALADFGSPHYGGVLKGQLVYPDAAFGWKADCKPAGCNYGCVPFNESTPPLQLKREPGKRYVMLLDRGPKDSTGLPRPCFFLEKAWQAQMAGADALLVANDHTGDLSTAVAPDDEDSTRELSQLTISAGLISQADGEALKALLRQGPVTVGLNWTNVLPKAQKVSVQFWTNSNDECGLLCDTQRAFVKRFKPVAKQLQQQGLLDFQLHYLIWVCDREVDSREQCESQCIRDGAFCSPDPDGSIHTGYTGADVLKMNLRSLCFAREARERGQPWLWFDFVERLGDECRMGDGNFTAECAQKVFDAVAGPAVGGPEGRAAWAACADAAGSGPLPLLDEELAAQTGQQGEGAVAILPTIRINGKQYRGNLEAGSVLRAVCAAFPSGAEPPVCVERWVSEDECEEGGVGWLACNSGANSTVGRTRCINTFSGWSCECGDGYLRVKDKATGEDACAEINECLASVITLKREDCSCPRCVCTNTPGGFNCSGPIPDYCTPEHDYGGCWRGTFGGQPFHACADNIRTYRYLAQSGALNATSQPFRCECPPCFRAAPSGGCEPSCDLELCSEALGACLSNGAAAGGGRGSTGGGAGVRGGGVGFLGVLAAMLCAAALTAGGLYAAYSTVLRERLRSDVHRVMEEYIPLASAPRADPNDPGDTPASTPSFELR